MKLAVIDTAEQLQAIKSDWERLFSTLTHPGFYHTWEWHYTLKNTSVGARAQFFCVYDEGDLVFVCPLLVKRSRFNQLYFAEAICSKYIDLCDVVMADGYDNVDFFQFIQQQFFIECAIRLHSFRFKKVKAHSLLLSMTHLHKKYSKPQGGNMFFPCEDESFAKKLSKKNIKNVSRLSRKLTAEKGNVSFRHYDSKASIEKYLPIFIELENQGWKGDINLASSIKMDAELHQFLITFADVYSKVGCFCINMLFVDDEPVAGQVAFKAGLTWYIYKIAYAPEFANYGPGNILLHQFLQWSAGQSDVTEVNLITAPQWASRWQSQREDVFTVVVFAKTTPGYLLNYYMHGYSKIKTTAKTCVTRYKVPFSQSIN